MLERIERKCVGLFGYCPLNIHDFVAGKTYGYTEKDFLYEAARKHYISEQHNFFTALCDWKDGRKMPITKEEAEIRNHYFNNAKALIDEKVPFSVDTPVNWMVFPKDDPTKSYYIGLPFDAELCVWAEQYNK